MSKDYKEIDDQASLLPILKRDCPELFKMLTDEKSPDGKPLMSHSYRIIDFSKAKNDE